MLRYAFNIMFWLLPVIAFGKTPIFGEPEVGIDHIYNYVSSHNPDFKRELAEAFYRIGQRYGIRGDIAICQAIIETGWFRFDNGTAVTPDAHNYCGLGVRKRGDKGCSFSSIEEGVTAMIQHLYAYASKKQLPKGEKIIDPRFSYVNRGCAPTWEKLAGRWAMNPHYGSNIMRIYSALYARSKGSKTIHFIEVDIPDELIANSSETTDQKENDTSETTTDNDLFN